MSRNVGDRNVVVYWDRRRDRLTIERTAIEHEEESSRMGKRLVEIVRRVESNSRGLPSVDLARLNLRVGKPLSRMAADLPDDPEVVAKAEAVAAELLEGVDG